MKRIILTIFLGLFVVTLSKAQEVQQNAEIEIVEVAASKKSDVSETYQCPMDCEKGKTYSKEGTCPVCKMDLKKIATNKGEKAACDAKKAKGCCAGKKATSKASCGTKAKASCAGKKKSCSGKK